MIRLTYGVANDGTLRHVSDVPPGRACGLRCPACGGKLIAKRGKILQGHLAHATHTSCVEEKAADLGMRAAAAALLAAHGRVLVPELRHFVSDTQIETLAPPSVVAIEEPQRCSKVGEARADLRFRAGDLTVAVFFRIHSPTPTARALEVAADGAALLEIWIPQNAIPEQLTQAAAYDGFRTWRVHPNVVRLAPEIRDSPAVRRLSPAERAKAAILYGLTPPEPVEPPIVHPLIGRPIPRGALMGEPDAVWQARILGAIVRAEQPISFYELEAMLRPPVEARGYWRPSFAKVMREVRLRHPTDVLRAWLQEGIRAGLIEMVRPGLRYKIGPAFSAHDRMALAALTQD